MTRANQLRPRTRRSTWDSGRPGTDRSTSHRRHKLSRLISRIAIKPCGSTCFMRQNPDSTPFRVSARMQLDPVETNTVQTTLRWRMIDVAGATLGSGELPIEGIRSAYDHISDGYGVMHVTEPARFFFDVPANVEAIEFESASPVLVNAHTRPSQSVAKTRIPHDLQPFARRRSLSRRWYTKRPTDREALALESRQQFIRLQARPPTDNADIISGNYTWEDFRPDGKWTGRFLLEPQADEAIMRQEAIPSSYWRFVSGGNEVGQYDVRVIATGTDRVKPKLIYQADGPCRLRLLLDDELLMDRTLRSSHGVLSLPEVSVEAGRARRLTIEAERPLRAYINYLQLDGSRRYLKRLAQLPDNGHIRFRVEKRTSLSELFMLRVFLPENIGANESTSVRIRVVPVGAEEVQAKAKAVVRKAWTFLERVYEFEPTSTGEHALVAGQSRYLTDSGHACYVLLDEDVSAGEYDIDVECHPQSHLVLYRTTPGQSDRLRIYRESMTP